MLARGEILSGSQLFQLAILLVKGAEHVNTPRGRLRHGVTHGLRYFGHMRCQIGVDGGPIHVHPLLQLRDNSLAPTFVANFDGSVRLVNVHVRVAID